MSEARDALEWAKYRLPQMAAEMHPLFSKEEIPKLREDEETLEFMKVVAERLSQVRGGFIRERRDLIDIGIRIGGSFVQALKPLAAWGGIIAEMGSRYGRLEVFEALEEICRHPFRPSQEWPLRST
jgi:hypothetical protein